MKTAIEEAATGMNGDEGGPFGAVVVHRGRVIARAHNQVIATHDPTAHAEIVAIRKASKKLGRFDLSDCAIYATCEPCPMCLSAIYWAKISTLYYGCTEHDTIDTGFADKDIHDRIRNARPKNLVRTQIEREACLELFKAWKQKPDKILY